jgi:hypothetical protein
MMTKSQPWEVATLFPRDFCWFLKHMERETKVFPAELASSGGTYDFPSI